MTEAFIRSSLLLGDKAMTRIESARIILFGVGGVGSWCAEGLIRNGVRHLTIVDCDNVCESNINRQLEATSLTVGQVKVEVMKARLLEINPEAEIVAINKQYTHENSAEFALDDYDYIIDAIDSLKDKIDLLLTASRCHGQVFSSMGAAKKIDPCKVKVAELFSVRGCPLGAMIRKRMRQNKTLPAKAITCVYDEEVLENAKDKETRINGSLVHITSIFGMTLCGLILKDLYYREGD